MGKKLCILISLVLPGLGIAQDSIDFHSKDSISSRNISLYIAQNIEEDKEAAEKDKEIPMELPPFPAPKTIISTEKPIEGGLILREPVETVISKKEDIAAIAVPAEMDTILSLKEDTSVPPVPTEPEKAAPIPKKDLKIMEELSLYNVPTGNLRTMKFIIDEEYNTRSMVYGEELGYIRVLDADNDDNFREVWKSPPLNAAVRGVFVEDLDGDGETDIIAYTSDGNFFIYGYETHDLKYRTPDGTYININCMVVANMDNDPEIELLFIGVKPGEEQPNGSIPAGYLIQFDPQSQFEEWISQEKYTATDMIIGNVDNDDELEIILNTGEILDVQFKELEWQSTTQFGSRLYLIDMDNDGILELVTEYDQSYIRIIDVDQRREKW